MLLAKYIYKRRCVFLKMSRVGILVLDSITFRDICDGAYPNARGILDHLNTFKKLYYIDTLGIKTQRSDDNITQRIIDHNPYRYLKLKFFERKNNLKQKIHIDLLDKLSNKIEYYLGIESVNDNIKIYNYIIELINSFDNLFNSINQNDGLIAKIIDVLIQQQADRKPDKDNVSTDTAVNVTVNPLFEPPNQNTVSEPPNQNTVSESPNQNTDAFQQLIKIYEDIQKNENDLVEDTQIEKTKLKEYIINLMQTIVPTSTSNDCKNIENIEIICLKTFFNDNIASNLSKSTQIINNVNYVTNQAANFLETVHEVRKKDRQLENTVKNNTKTCEPTVQYIEYLPQNNQIMSYTELRF